MAGADNAAHVVGLAACRAPNVRATMGAVCARRVAERGGCVMMRERRVVALIGWHLVIEARRVVV